LKKGLGWFRDTILKNAKDIELFQSNTGILKIKAKKIKEKKKVSYY